jgi:hypothetical protein
MKKTLRDAINDAVVEYLEHKIQTDESVNVVAMANEIVQSLVDMIMEQEEGVQAPLLASIITTLGDEYLHRRGLTTNERRDN